MNSWIIGGFAGLGLLVVFLTSPYNGTFSTLSYLTYYGDPGIVIVILLLLGASGFSFYKGLQETEKKK